MQAVSELCSEQDLSNAAQLLPDWNQQRYTKLAGLLSQATQQQSQENTQPIEHGTHHKQATLVAQSLPSLTHAPHYDAAPYDSAPHVPRLRSQAGNALMRASYAAPQGGACDDPQVPAGAGEVGQLHLPGTPVSCSTLQPATTGGTPAADSSLTPILCNHSRCAQQGHTGVKADEARDPPHVDAPAASRNCHLPQPFGAMLFASQRKTAKVSTLYLCQCNECHLPVNHLDPWARPASLRLVFVHM